MKLLTTPVYDKPSPLYEFLAINVKYPSTNSNVSLLISTTAFKAFKIESKTVLCACFLSDINIFVITRNETGYKFLAPCLDIIYVIASTTL